MRKIYGLVWVLILLVFFAACSNDALVQIMETATTEATTVPVEFEFKGVENDDFYFCIEKYLGDDEYIVLPTAHKGFEVLAIGDSVFFGSKAKTIVIPEGLLEIGDYAFAYSEFENIEIPNTVKTIGKQCFEGMKIREIKIPAGVEKISYGLFQGCANLETIILPTTIKECSRWAFDDCSNLKNIHFAGVISERDARKIFTSFYNLPKNCVLTALDSRGNTVNLYDDNVHEEEYAESNKITVNNMEDGAPYLLVDGEIQSIKQINVDRGTISEQHVNEIPKVSKKAKIIVRMEKSDFDEASLTQLLIQPEENGYINSPYVDFAYIDGKVYLKLTSGTYEVDNINGIKRYEDMPLVHNARHASDVNSYVLYNLSGATKYIVGYWEGTKYKETEVDISYTVAKYNNKSKYRCDFSKTYDGYFILNLPDLEPGYYVMGGFRNDQNKLESYVIYFE